MKIAYFLKEEINFLLNLFIATEIDLLYSIYCIIENYIL